MPRMNLTAAAIAKLEPRAKPYIVFDTQVRPLGVRVSPKGGKAFVARYTADGKDKVATIGDPAAMSLKDARASASAIKVAVDNGEQDPASKAAKRREDVAEGKTITAAVERYFAEYVPSRAAKGSPLSPRTVSDYRTYADRTVVPRLGSMLAADVTQDDIEAAVDHLGATQMRLTLAFLSVLFKQAKRWGWTARNPVSDIERPPQGKRERALKAREIVALGAALPHPSDCPVSAAISFMLIQGFRVGEVIRLEWGHIDEDEGEISLPETKTGPQTRPLLDEAKRLLADVPRLHQRTVFPTTEHTIRRRLAAASERAGIDKVVPHDLRSTCATRLAAAGVTLTVIRDVLGHANIAMSARYAKNDVSAAKAGADAGAKEIGLLLRGDGKVTPLRRSAGR